MDKIDWTNPVETETGVRMEYRKDIETGEESFPFCVMCPSDSMIVSYYDWWGAPWNKSKPRLRNVVAAPKDLNERCVALIERMASEHVQGVFAWQREAKAIIAAMNPVDPDLIEARDCVAKVYEDAGRNDLAIATRDGKQDNRLRVQSALAAFRRGRDFGNGGK